MFRGLCLCAGAGGGERGGSARERGQEYWYGHVCVLLKGTPALKPSPSPPLAPRQTFPRRFQPPTQSKAPWTGAHAAPSGTDPVLSELLGLLRTRQHWRLCACVRVCTWGWPSSCCCCVLCVIAFCPCPFIAGGRKPPCHTSCRRTQAPTVGTGPVPRARGSHSAEGVCHAPEVGAGAFMGWWIWRSSPQGPESGLWLAMCTRSHPPLAARAVVVTSRSKSRRCFQRTVSDTTCAPAPFAQCVPHCSVRKAKPEDGACCSRGFWSSAAASQVVPQQRDGRAPVQPYAYCTTKKYTSRAPSLRRSPNHDSQARSKQQKNKTFS